MVNDTFLDILKHRLEMNGFSKKRVQDSIDHVIDNCIYPTPSVANFITFDKTIKFYSYEEMIAFGIGTDKFRKIRIKETQEKPLWVFEKDFIVYNLEHLKW